MIRIAALLLLLTGIALPEAVGLIRADYDPAGLYISELGAEGAGHAALITYAGFLPVAALTAVIIAQLMRTPGTAITARIGLGLLLTLSIGYLGAVLYPCLPGCPIPGTGRQAMHNTAGVIQYLGSMAGFALLASITLRRGTRLMRWATPPATFAVIVGAILAGDPAWADWKGALQRLADYSAFLWLALAASAGRITVAGD